MSSASPQPKYRPMAFGVPRVLMREGASGVRYLRGEPELEAYAPTMGERLAHWARVAPDRTLFARRERHADGSAGDWQHLSFAQALDGARRIGQALIDRGLNAERPVVMLSENDLDHALLSLACLYVGVPYCSTSPAYSTISTDHGKLKHVMATLTPGLVFASDGARYAKAINAAVPADCDVVLSQVNGYERASGKVFTFAELLATEATAAVDEAAARVTPPFLRPSMSLPTLSPQCPCFRLANWLAAPPRLGARPSGWCGFSSRTIRCTWLPPAVLLHPRPTRRRPGWVCPS